MTPCSFTSIGTACAGTVILLKNIGDNYPDTGGKYRMNVAPFICNGFHYSDIDE